MLNYLEIPSEWPHEFLGTKCVAIASASSLIHIPKDIPNEVKITERLLILAITFTEWQKIALCTSKELEDNICGANMLT